MSEKPLRQQLVGAWARGRLTCARSYLITSSGVTSKFGGTLRGERTGHVLGLTNVVE